MVKKNILITGATGLIGSALIKKLSKNGYTPVILSTSRSEERLNIYKWNPLLETCDKLPDGEYHGIINLAGASIADTRWNKAGKEVIEQSRTASTLFLKNVVDGLPNPPKHIISVSAIGYYGVINDEIKTENSPNGNDFAALVCKDWEDAAKQLETTNSDLSILRIGIVLVQKGGFYKKISNLAKWKIAAPIGTGMQPVCWIHIEDLITIFLSILDEKLNPGVYNAVASISSNKEVTKEIVYKSSQPFVWPAIPSFLIKLIFGEKAEIFTKGAKISNSKLLNAGFDFQFTDLNKAITNLAKD